MKRANLLIVYAVIGITGTIGLLGVIRNFSTTQKTVNIRQSIQKWEYRAVYKNAIQALIPENEPDRFQRGLNQLGGEGWELVTVDPSFVQPFTSGGTTIKGVPLEPVQGKALIPSLFIFKRSLPSD